MQSSPFLLAEHLMLSRDSACAMYDDTEASGKGSVLLQRTSCPLPANPTVNTGTPEGIGINLDEYESLSEESNYDYITRPCEMEEPKAVPEPPGPEINTVTALSSFATPQWKGLWKQCRTAAFVAPVGLCLLLLIILLSQQASILLELRKLNFSSLQEGCEFSTASLMIKELKIAFEVELQELGKHIEKGEEEDRKVNEQILRIKEKLNLLQNKMGTYSSLNSLPWRTFEESCYYFSEIPVTWQEAEQFCTKFEAHLIIINSRQEQDFVVMKTNFSIWLGLTDAQKENEWLWVDRSRLQESYWRWGEPNNSGGNEDCAALYTNGVWNDIPCNTKSLFVCEKRVCA